MYKTVILKLCKYNFFTFFKIVGKISTLKFVEHWPELDTQGKSNQKLVKKSDTKSTQFKFQQSFPSIVNNETIHSNFATTTFTEKDVNFLFKLI